MLLLKREQIELELKKLFPIKNINSFGSINNIQNLQIKLDLSNLNYELSRQSN